MLLVLAIQRQEEGGLARDVLKEQLAMGFPGLGHEVREICKELGLPDATRMDINKKEVKEAIQLSSLREVKAEMAGKTKLQELALCDLREAQSYMDWSVEESRMAFRLQNRMLDCRDNMPARYKRDKICRACQPSPATGMEGQEETQEHLEVCPGYGELWQGLGPLTPRSRVKYFMKLKTKRLKSVLK